MYFITSLVVISAVMVFVVKAQVPLDNICTTPRNERGACVTLTRCPPLVTLLRQRPIPNNVLTFLRRSTCGFDGNTPRVCCPLDSISGNNRPPPVNPPPVTQRPVDDPLSTHANFRLLPARKDCGVSASLDRIIGGKDANLGAFPWMALLGYRRSNTSTTTEWLCGGSLISDRYVLTAAHCITPSLILQTVRLGEHKISNAGTDCISDTDVCAPPVQDVPIENVIVHPSYNTPARHRNDIALIRLRNQVKMGPYVRPTCLPFGEVRQLSLDRLSQGQNLFVAGWGRTNNNRYAASNSDTLQVVDVPEYPLPRCTDIYQRNIQLDDSQLCAGGVQGKDSCSGDSGGPLLLRNGAANQTPKFFQVGVVSIGPVTCGTANQPGIYTRVSKYVDWILNNIKP